MFQPTSPMKSYSVERMAYVNIMIGWKKIHCHSHHLCSPFHFLFLFDGNVTVLFDAPPRHVCSTRGQTGELTKYRRWRSFDDRVSAVDRPGVDTDDTDAVETGHGWNSLTHVSRLWFTIGICPPSPSCWFQPDGNFSLWTTGVLYFWKALGTRIAKILDPDVWGANTQL
jgi:hypothetical protein